MRRAGVALTALVLAAIAASCRARSEAPAPAPRTDFVVPTPAASAALPDEGEGPPVDGGTLERRLVGEPTTLNAVLQTALPEAQVLQYVQRNLFDFDGGLRLVPGLAAGIEVSQGGREYLVTLRPEAVWEDGRPVTAADAVFTIGTVADPEVPAPVFQSLFDGLERIEALDDRRFRAVFREAYAFREMAFVLPLLPAHRFEGRDFRKAPDNRAPLSNGPYRVVAWKSGESVELARNPEYWAPRGYFDRVVFRILPDNTTAYRLLVAGDLDENQIDATLRARAQADARFAECCRLLEFYNLDWSYVALNTKSAFFEDARVRRALTMLSDRAAVAGDLYRGSARVISGPWAPDSPAYDPALAPLPFDPASAAALLDEAGWRDSDGDGTRDKDGKEFEFDLLVSAGSEIGRQVDEMLASELARSGIRARVRSLEWAAFIERVDAGQFEAASLAWSAVDPNPDPYPYWHSSQCPPRGLNNGCYRNPEADRLMVEARRELDASKRQALFHRLHRIFRDDAPAIFLVNSTQKYGLNRSIRGVTTSPLGLSGTWPGPIGWWKSPSAQPAFIRKPAA
jgi:peptide/nickel transport system substrate-binding protein